MRDAVQELKLVERFLSHDYHKISSAYNRNTGNNFQYKSDIQYLIQEIEFCSAIIEICEHQALIEDDYLTISANASKANIVEYVYLMTIYYKGPPLVTNPNSDFAYACSILYELATGKSDEGLSGAINRFSKSARRKNIDRDACELAEENSLGDSVDNFSYINKIISSASSDYEKFHLMSETDSISLYAKSIARALELDAIESIKKSQKKYGPNLILAHQLPESELISHYEAFKILENKRKKATIGIGRLRRSRRGVS